MYNAYFDYAATTPVAAHLIELYNFCQTNDWFNPSSHYAIELQQNLRQMQRELIHTLSLPENGRLILTSGATEAINLALKGSITHTSEKTILSSNIEHAAVSNTLNFLQQTYHIPVITIPANSQGLIDPQRVSDALTEKTVFCSWIVVQNEIGTINPVRELYQIVKKYNPNILVHLDASQAVGKIPFNDFLPYGDLISFSGHKFFAPKGIGGLFQRSAFPLQAQIHGGGQQSGLRGGTINYPLIRTFHQAMLDVTNYFQENLNRVNQVHDYLINEIKKRFTASLIINQPPVRVPHIIPLILPGIKGEVIQNYLATEKIYIGTGSACSGHSQKKMILTRLQKPKEIAECAIRLSISHLTTETEVDRLIQALGKISQLI